MTYEKPTLHPIDSEMLLFGKVHIMWSDVGAPIYYLYRDYDPIENISGWQPYKIIEDGKTHYDDNFFTNNRTYYYAVVAISKDGSDRSKLSNSEKIKIKLPPNLIVDHEKLKEAAYFESCKKCHPDEKIWQLARYKLIIERTFPKRSFEYLRVHLKILKNDLPEFKGLFFEPNEAQIRKKAVEIYNKHPSDMDINWELSELKLIKKKIEDLIEYESQIR